MIGIIQGGCEKYTGRNSTMFLFINIVLTIVPLISSVAPSLFTSVRIDLFLFIAERDVAYFTRRGT